MRDEETNHSKEVKIMENKQKMAVLERAAYYIGVLKSAIKFNAPEEEKNVWRGMVKGLLEAAAIMTGSTFEWDGDGIYENHGNEPVVRA